MSVKADNLIWIDLEMTGLDVENDLIIEIATIITDSDLEILAEGPVLAIHQANEVLNKMDQWNKEHHSHSGLLDRVRASKLNEMQAQTATLEFLMTWVPPNKSPMCGNSICQDRRFLARYMPDLEKYFHYRQLDVSTLKILAQRWAPNVAAGISKVSEHIALRDIKDSIEELRYYRQYFIK